MSDRLRRCSICKQDKEDGDFRKLKNSPNAYSSHCKPCAAAYLREWRHKNIDRVKAQRRARYQAEGSYEREYKRVKGREDYAKDPEKFRDARLRYQFGITLDEYRAKEAAQQGKCAICGEECKSGRSLAVDHNHDSGDVRGLLCANCNRALGLFAEDPDRLLAAAAYLLSYQDVLKGATQ